jgi:hypothetical protein
LIFIVSCSESNLENTAEKAVQTDLKKENLKGKVLMVVNENDWELSFTTYNSAGNKETKFEGDMNGSFLKESYNYVNNQLTSVSILNLGGERTEVLKYDERNNLEKKELPDSNSTFYFYDDSNKLIKDSISFPYDPNLIIVSNYYYNKRGDLDSMTTIENLTHIEKMSYVVEKFTNSLINERIWYNITENGGREIVEKIKYNYNENGYVSKIDEENFNKNIRNIKTYNYTYDEYNNWIKSEEFINDKFNKIKNRKIFYEGDDVSSYVLKMNQIIPPSKKEGSLGSNRVPSPGNSSLSGGSIDQGDNSSQFKNCAQCNGSGQCRECSKTFRREYYKGNGSYDNRNETKAGYIMCNDCRGRGHKQVKRNEGGWEPGGDCHVSGCMDGWIFCRSCNQNGNGRNIGKCERCKGSGQE